MMPLRAAATTLLLAAWALSWLHYAAARPAGTMLWVDSLVFWVTTGILALIWGPSALGRLTAFLRDWHGSDERRLNAFLGVATAGGLLLAVLSRHDVVAALGLLVAVSFGALLLVLTGRRDLRRLRGGERLVGLKWFLLLGFLLSYAALLGHLVTAEPHTVTPQAIRSTLLLFFLALLAFTAGHWLKRGWRRLFRRRDGDGDAGLSPPNAVQ